MEPRRVIRTRRTGDQTAHLEWILAKRQVTDGVEDFTTDSQHTAEVNGRQPPPHGTEPVGSLRTMAKKSTKAKRAPDGTTPLSMAATVGRADIAEILLNGGADPNLLGNNRDAPLLIATRARNAAFVEALLRHNADLEETDVTGRTALDLAEENHYREIVSILRAAGAY